MSYAQHARGERRDDPLFPPGGRRAIVGTIPASPREARGLLISLSLRPDVDYRIPGTLPAVGKEMHMSRRSWGIPAGLAAAALAIAFPSLPANALPASAARAAGHNASAPAAGLNVRAPQRGTGHAGAAEKVNVRALAAAPRAAARTPAASVPRGVDGRPAGASLPHLATRGHRPVPAAAPRIATGANSRGTARAALQGMRPLAAPGTINASFNGS